LNDLTTTIVIGVALVGVLILSFVVQGWRTRRAPIGKVVGIASHVRYNEKICEGYSENSPVGRFKTSAWNKHRESVDFLPEELWDELANVFETIEELNVTIDTARKLGSPGYVAASDIERLKAPLASCKEQIQDWVYANMNNPEYLPKKRSIFFRR
jgi:hypothetical protein